MMSKKHFKALAEGFKNLSPATMTSAKPHKNIIMKSDVYLMLLAFCQQSNPNFDESRFYNACHGLPS